MEMFMKTFPSFQFPVSRFKERAPLLHSPCFKTIIINRDKCCLRPLFLVWIGLFQASENSFRKRNLNYAVHHV